MVLTAPAHGFDTLAHARRLKEAGVDEAQADLEAAVADLKADITRIEGKMATKADLYRALWIQAGVIVAAIAALAGLIAGAGQPAP